MRTSAARKAGSDDTRQRILEAGLSVFAEKGYDGAATREIAARAGVPQGLIGYHFGDKLRLWKAAVDRAFAEIHAGLDLSPPADSVEPPEVAAIRAGIRAHVRYVGRHPEFVRIMHDEGKRRGPRMRWIVDRHVKPMFERLVPLMEQIAAIRGLPASSSPHHLAYALIGAIDTIFNQAEECRRLGGFDPLDPAAVEAHALVVESLFLGPAPKA